jgi:hypothetical protein
MVYVAHRQKIVGDQRSLKLSAAMEFFSENGRSL